MNSLIDINKEPNWKRESIFDKSGLLCHVVIRGSIFSQLDGRVDISDPGEFLQLGVISGPKGKAFRPHVHLERSVHHTNFLAQESWVVIKGEVEATFYDQAGLFICKKELRQGDSSVSFRGGHGYRLLRDSLIYEYKTGPYLGQAQDKRFID